MFAYLSVIGLILIILSWIIQIVKIKKGNKEICSCFAMLQFLGIVLLIIESILSTNITLAIGNGLSALGAIIVFFMVGKCNCCCKENCATK